MHLRSIFRSTVCATVIGAFSMAMPELSVAQDTEAEVVQPPLSLSSHPILASTSTEDVGARLVCLFDVSGSINEEEYNVQLEAMAKAIESDDFYNAINFIGGPGSIAICVADFGTNASVQIPWVDVRAGERQKLKDFANEVRKITRRESGNTGQIKALQLSKILLDSCPWDSPKSVVDMITDGINNNGILDDLKSIRDILVQEHGATINALITLDEGEDIEGWMRDYMITQPSMSAPDQPPVKGGFLMVVATQQSVKQQGKVVEYRDAMTLAFRRKLILEIACIPLDKLRAIVQAENKIKTLSPNL